MSVRRLWALSMLWPILPAAGEVLDSPLVALDPLEAIREGQLLLQVRARYEWVEQERPGGTVRANWGSVRTAIGWKTLEYAGFSAVAEAIDLSTFAGDGGIDYRSTPPFTGVYAGSGWVSPYAGPYPPGYYPLLKDPDRTDVNRLYVDYSGWPHTLVRFGRQPVRLDNQRFIGDYD